MNNVDWSIINTHEQIYCMSCISSGVEMILKLEGQLNPTTFTEQDKWRNSQIGFDKFDNVTISGITFKQEFTNPKGPGFPLDDLFARVKSEIAAGRYVAVSLSPGGAHHIWVIYEFVGIEFLAFSKAGPNTIFQTAVAAVIRQMKGTDILTYTR